VRGPRQCADEFKIDLPFCIFPFPLPVGGCRQQLVRAGTSGREGMVMIATVSVPGRSGFREVQALVPVRLPADEPPRQVELLRVAAARLCLGIGI
jgi:hypothetical protein